MRPPFDNSTDDSAYRGIYIALSSGGKVAGAFVSKEVVEVAVGTKFDGSGYIKQPFHRINGSVEKGEFKVLREFEIAPDKDYKSDEPTRSATARLARAFVRCMPEAPKTP